MYVSLIHNVLKDNEVHGTLVLLRYGTELDTPVTLSVKLPLASCPPVAVTRQVNVPPLLVKVVFTTKMCSL